MIPEVWDVLEEVIHEHPVLLNRAPTLHRLGIQAFEPVLVEGKAIQIHPLVCHAFNADFDGDQMAVHVPLSAEAQAEARVLMLSSNNILSPAHGKPLATPTQDMVLGVYYLTYGPSDEELEGMDPDKVQPRPHVFRTAQEAELSYDNRSVRLHDLAMFRREKGDHIFTTVGRIIFNDRIERALEETLGEGFKRADHNYINQTLTKRSIGALVEQLVVRYGAPSIALVLDAFKELGFHFASQGGITISKNDVVTPAAKEGLLEHYEGEVAQIQGQYDQGLITLEERHEKVVDTWQEASDRVAQAMQDELDELNPIYMMANSGARGSFTQIRQLAGMRGLMANPKGEIIERPIKASFMEGLTVLEYFISTHGARKGLADTALRTADSGYLTRRLVDVAQDVIVRQDDCKTKEFISMSLFVDGDRVNDNLIGRVSAQKFETKRGRVLLEKNQLIGRDDLRELVEAHTGELTTKIPVRSVLNCEADAGVCASCYGVSPATGSICELGDAVGIVAAQSIGEPGTQLTMRTFHTGGVAGADITHGLPRVVELFEARKPKGEGKMATVAGIVDVEDLEKERKVTIVDSKAEEHVFRFPRRTRIVVEKGQKVEKGDQLTEGSLYPAELLELRGRGEIERYLVNEVQEVYKSQGVDINDKHLEVIVRQMLRRVKVDRKGETDCLPGSLIDRVALRRMNDKIKSGKKGEQATAEEVILGITKASLATDSFLSAASFQETTKVLTDASLEGRIDRLLGLKENVIIGKLIPAATGLKHYRTVEIEPTEPVTRPTADEIGILDEEQLASELGLSDGEGLEGLGAEISGEFGDDFGADFDLGDGGAQRGADGGAQRAADGGAQRAARDGAEESSS
jgi:DNA-directed RNA polymerase subunit beta'